MSAVSNTSAKPPPVPLSSLSVPDAMPQPAGAKLASMPLRVAQDKTASASNDDVPSSAATSGHRLVGALSDREERHGSKQHDSDTDPQGDSDEALEAASSSRGKAQGMVSLKEQVLVAARAVATQASAQLAPLQAAASAAQEAAARLKAELQLAQLPYLHAQARIARAQGHLDAADASVREAEAALGAGQHAMQEAGGHENEGCRASYQQGAQYQIDAAQQRLGAARMQLSAAQARLVQAKADAAPHERATQVAHLKWEDAAHVAAARRAEAAAGAAAAEQALKVELVAQTELFRSQVDLAQLALTEATLRGSLGVPASKADLTRAVRSAEQGLSQARAAIDRQELALAAAQAKTTEEWANGKLLDAKAVKAEVTATQLKNELDTVQLACARSEADVAARQGEVDAAGATVRDAQAVLDAARHAMVVAGTHKRKTSRRQHHMQASAEIDAATQRLAAGRRQLAAAQPGLAQAQAQAALLIEAAQAAQAKWDGAVRVAGAIRAQADAQAGTARQAAAREVAVQASLAATQMLLAQLGSVEAGTRKALNDAGGATVSQLAEVVKVKQQALADALTSLKKQEQSLAAAKAVEADERRGTLPLRTKAATAQLIAGSLFEAAQSSLMNARNLTEPWLLSAQEAQLSAQMASSGAAATVKERDAQQAWAGMAADLYAASLATLAAGQELVMQSHRDMAQALKALSAAMSNAGVAAALRNQGQQAELRARQFKSLVAQLRKSAESHMKKELANDELTVEAGATQMLREWLEGRVAGLAKLYDEAKAQLSVHQDDFDKAAAATAAAAPVAAAASEAMRELELQVSAAYVLPSLGSPMRVQAHQKKKAAQSKLKEQLRMMDDLVQHKERHPGLKAACQYTVDTAEAVQKAGQAALALVTPLRDSALRVQRLGQVVLSAQRELQHASQASANAAAKMSHQTLALLQSSQAEQAARRRLRDGLQAFANASSEGAVALRAQAQGARDGGVAQLLKDQADLLDASAADHAPVVASAEAALRFTAQSVAKCTDSAALWVEKAGSMTQFAAQRAHRAEEVAKRAGEDARALGLLGADIAVNALNLAQLGDWASAVVQKDQARAQYAAQLHDARMQIDAAQRQARKAKKKAVLMNTTAGSMAQQCFGLPAGRPEKFCWGNVGAAAITRPQDRMPGALVTAWRPPMHPLLSRKLPPLSTLFKWVGEPAAERMDGVLTGPVRSKVAGFCGDIKLLEVAAAGLPIGVMAQLSSPLGPAASNTPAGRSAIALGANLVLGTSTDVSRLPGRRMSRGISLISAAWMSSSVNEALKRAGKKATAMPESWGAGRSASPRRLPDERSRVM